MDTLIVDWRKEEVLPFALLLTTGALDRINESIFILFCLKSRALNFARMPTAGSWGRGKKMK